MHISMNVIFKKHYMLIVKYIYLVMLQYLSYKF